MERELTFGEQAVGLTFNPEGHSEVNVIKQTYAKIIDQLHDSRLATENGDKKRMYSEAITSTQIAQMWAVKAATWKY